MVTDCPVEIADGKSYKVAEVTKLLEYKRTSSVYKMIEKGELPIYKFQKRGKKDIILIKGRDIKKLFK